MESLLGGDSTNENEDGVGVAVGDVVVAELFRCIASLIVD